MKNLSTIFNIIGIYNFWIQEHPEYKNEKRSRVIEWLNDILDLFDIYLSSLQKIFELLIYAKNGIWHPELFNPMTLDLFQQSLNQNLIGFKFSEIMKFSKIQYCIFQHQLIFTLSSPKIGDEELEIFKTYALPINHNLVVNPKPTIFLKPEIQYVGTSNNKENYYIAANHYLNSCKRIGPKLICNYPSS